LASMSKPPPKVVEAFFELVKAFSDFVDRHR
jgi:hypothetical protein